MEPLSDESHCFNPCPGPQPGAFQLCMATSLGRSTSSMSGLSLGPAIAHPMGSGILAQPLSSPADLREGWVSPWTLKKCRKNEPNFWVGLTSAFVPLGSPGLVLRCRTTAHSGCPGLAGCQPWRSQIASQRGVASSLCLCQVSFERASQQTASHPQQQHSRAGRDRTGLWRCRETRRPSHP